MCSLPCKRSIIGTNIAANCDDVDDDAAVVMVEVDVGDVIDNGPRGRTNDASLERVSIFVIWIHKEEDRRHETTANQKER